eukprot:gene29397-38486_t
MIENENPSKGLHESSIPSAIESLLKARTTNEILLAMDCINIPEKDGEMDAAEFLPFKDPLKKAVQNSIVSMNSLINKQIRRRMNRLLYVLATKEEKAAIDSAKVATKEGTNKAAARSVEKSSVKQTVHDVTNVIDQIIEKEISPELFKRQVEDLQAVTSSVELLAFLETFSSNCPGEDETKQILREKLNDLCNNPTIGSNARIRRRIKRAMESLEEKTTDEVKSSVVHQESNIKIVKVTEKPVKPVPEAAKVPMTLTVDKPTEPWVPIPPELINQVSQCQSASDLIEAISALRPSAGTCKTRRTLKRAIEKVLTKEEVRGELCARSRRKVSRALQLLEPHDGAHRQPPEETPAVVPQSTSVAQDSDSIANKKNPYVVFISQLPYSVTASEVSQHLEKHGVTGPIQIRLLTHSDTGNSKGVAFADLSDAQQLHKCLTLHHSVLGGRLINVEKSCGGRSRSVREERLAQRRAEQQAKVSAAIQALWTEAQTQGVFSVDLKDVSPFFREKMFAFSPAIVSKMLKKLSSSHSAEDTISDGQKIAMLDDLLSRAVHSSRGKRESGLSNEQQHHTHTESEAESESVVEPELDDGDGVGGQ